ncbi:beta strand repeat-containing protein [Winogradskyella undariae]|uniref:beta strand repeat-containing protein n=1 Tax=Winogradskyella undariae TaxID=1285465 RepID=UPI0015C7734E|nr:lamin tail domain-containing protein [Winogradskyella undariae]
MIKLKKYINFLALFLCVSLSSHAQATLPLSRTNWNTEPTGWTDSSTGAYLSSFACSNDNAAKFSTDGQNKVVHFYTTPDKLTFVTKTTSVSSTSSLLIEESTDGSNYTEVIELTPDLINLSMGCESKGPYTLNSNTRYVKWTYTKPSIGGGNMAIDDVEITAGATSPCTIASLGLTDIYCDDNLTAYPLLDDNITFKLNPTGTNLGTTYNVSVDGINSVTPTSGVYGVETDFTLQAGSAFNGDVIVTITDISGNCTQNVVLTNPGPCSGVIPTPTITVSQNTLSNLDYTYGSGPSAEQSFDIEGLLLIAGIRVNAPTNFLISLTSGGPYTSTLDIPILPINLANGTNTIYVVLEDGLEINTYSGTITTTYLTSGLTTTPSVSVDGEVTASTTNVCLSDNFNSDYGNWADGTGTYNNLESGTTGNGIGFNDNNDHIITSASIVNPASINFNARASGSTSNFTINIQYATSNSGPWTTAETIVANGSNTGTITDVTQAFSYTLDLTGTYFLRILQSPRSGGSLYLDDVEVNCNTLSPKIDIERNNGTSIPNGAIANTTYNTVFLTTEIGSSTAAKDYYVSNEGTADLSLTSITSSNSDFVISLNPAATTITAGTEEIFQITYTPTTTGLSTSTITIVSNDTDENPYTFQVSGSGECVSGSIDLFPAIGPIGTTVSVISSNASFGSSTTASIGGISASINVISALEIEVTIPTGALTGSIEIYDDLGCLSHQIFTVVTQLISDCEGTIGTAPTNLFISEVTDAASGSHSYIEIYNGTGAPVDLNDYEIRLHNNGAATATATVELTGGILANDNAYLLAIGGSNATDPEGGFTADQFSSTGGVNDDDNIRLYFNNGIIETWVDLWGNTTGNAFTITSKDYTYRRKNSGITVPSTTWNTADWETITPVDYSDMKHFDFSMGEAPTITLQPEDIGITCSASNTFTIAGTEGYNGDIDLYELAYQWYYYAPGALNWTEILPTDLEYTGQQTARLNIVNTSKLNGYQYYCQLRENNATCFTASNAAKLEVLVSEWNGTGWSTPPTTNSAIVLDSDYNTSTATNGETSFEACSCTINSGSQLTIADDTYVLIENDLTVDGSLIVRKKGSFIQVNDNATIKGDVLTTRSKITVEKQTANLNTPQEYTYWSSPVAGETVAAGLSEANFTGVYWYSGQNFLDATKETDNDNGTVTGQDDIDDNGDDWQYAPSGSIMLPGVGYAATHASAGFTTGQQLYAFNGAFNNGVYNVPIYRNDSETNDNNWNLIGNPYPSAIDADKFLTANTNIDTNAGTGTINGAIFFWSQNTAASGTTNGNETLNYAQTDYAIINGAGETAGGDLIAPTRFIPSGQAFFIAMDNDATATTVSTDIKTANVVFNNSMRTTGNNDQFFRTQNTNTPNKLWIDLTTDTGIFNQLLVAYVPGATDGDDGMYYDAQKNLATSVQTIIYSLIDNNTDKKFAIQAKNTSSLTLDEVVPLGFNTSITTPTIYTLSIHKLQGAFLTDNTVYLKDKKLDIYHNLSNSDYNFTSEAGNFNNRFEIVFREEVLSIDHNVANANTLTITELQNGTVKFKVENGYAIKHVDIIDANGRYIYSLPGENSTEIYNLSKLSKAPYIAKTTLSNGQIISKKAIKQH